MSYVLFVTVLYSLNYAPRSGLGTFQYDFKDKIQCENTFKNMKKYFHHSKIEGVDVYGFCQEVRK